MIRWWNGLSPGDRRVASLFLTVIVGTVPLYLLVLSWVGLPALLRDGFGSTRVETGPVVGQQPSVAIAASPTPPVVVGAAPTPRASATTPPTAGRTETPLPLSLSPLPATPESTSTPVPAPPPGTATGPSGATATLVPARVASPTTMPPPPPEPRCQSAAGVAVPGTYFDIVEVSARPNQQRQLIVEGVARNNCDQPLRAVVRAEALNGGGRVIASEDVRVGRLAPDERARFRIDLGRVQGVARVRAVAELE